MKKNWVKSSLLHIWLSIDKLEQKHHQTSVLFVFDVKVSTENGEKNYIELFTGNKVSKLKKLTNMAQEVHESSEVEQIQQMG